MSSPAEEEEPRRVPGWRQPWDLWRVLMFVGSLVLLGLALSRVNGEQRLPDWLEVGLQFLGYAFLGIGFFLAMRMRRDLRGKSEKTRD